MIQPVCFIPARSGSKRFPRKNIAPFKGRPLVSYAIAVAAKSGIFSRICVSTDDDEIARIAKESGADVLARPRELGSDQATVVQVTLNACELLERDEILPDIACVMLPTAILVRPEDLNQAWAMLCRGNADFVMAVTTYLESPFWALHEENGYLQPYFSEMFSKRTQELPKVCVDSGAFYFARIDALRRERTFYGRRLVGYRIPRDRSIDIDEPVHLKIAEAFFDHAKCRQEDGRQ